MLLGMRSTLLSSFSPAALFAAGEQGVWYDPSDMTTLFQDSAGTTPVTAVEQPVGLMLDKSQGLVLGPELVTNGDFSAGATGWTVGSNWAISGGEAIATAAVYNTNNLDQSVSLVTGRTYKLTFNIPSYTAGSLRLDIVGVQSVISGGVTSAGGYTYYFVCANGGTRTLRCTGSTGGGFTGSVDNISVKEIAGNHATQSTPSARPVLSARVNLLTKTEQFDDGVWTKTGLQAFGSGSVANAATAPDGTTTADLITENTNNSNHSAQQSANVSSGASVVTSVAIKKPLTNGRSYAAVYITDAVAKNYAILVNLDDGTYVNYTGITGYSAPSSSSVVSLGDGWYRCTVSATLDAGRTIAGSGTLLRNSGTASAGTTYAGDGTSGILVWGADLRVANDTALPVYQRVNTSTDYDTTGFPMYLRFDGSDDSMSTGNINFTSTDEVTAFAGVRKQNDTVAVYCELSATINGNAGSFMLLSGTNNVTGFEFTSRGTDPPALGTTARFAVNAPVTAVTTNIGDISAPLASIRVNGVVGTNGTSTQGTGNYGNYPLYIGSRGGTTLRFNGRIYSLIVRGAATTEGLIGQTENWISGKMGGGYYPTGYDFLVDANGNQLTDASGNPLIAQALYS